MQFIKYHPMPLYKHCHLKHNIKQGWNTLRLGTLHSFRKHEDARLRDEGEGKFRYEIAFPQRTAVSPQWLQQFDIGDGGEVDVGQLIFTPSGVQVDRINLMGSSHNCWIFCVSTKSSGAGGISENYDSSWEISGDKVELFGRYLAAVLFDHITFDDLPQWLTSRLGIKEILSRLSIRIMHKAVEYGSRAFPITNESEAPVSKIVEWRASVPFRKPSGFSHEAEYRFTYTLLFDDEPVSIRGTHKDLRLRAVDSFLT